MSMRERIPDPVHEDGEPEDSGEFDEFVDDVLHNGEVNPEDVRVSHISFKNSDDDADLGAVYVLATITRVVGWILFLISGVCLLMMLGIVFGEINSGDGEAMSLFLCSIAAGLMALGLFASAELMLAVVKTERNTKITSRLMREMLEQSKERAEK